MPTASYRQHLKGRYRFGGETLDRHLLPAVSTNHGNDLPGQGTTGNNQNGSALRHDVGSLSYGHPTALRHQVLSRIDGHRGIPAVSISPYGLAKGFV
jgi:hypothetical protein